MSEGSHPKSQVDEASAERSSQLPADGLADRHAYLADRLQQYQRWYDRKAVRSKALYLRMRTGSVVGGGIVPVLVNVDVPYAKALTTALSLVVVVLVSLESVYHYREQWKNYRSTEQLLGHEQVYFENKIGPYEGMDEQSAFKLFVERVEGAISSENAATLNVMTLAAEAENRGGIASRAARS